MISPHKSAKTQNALLQRVQRYAQASTIFRTAEAGEGSTTNPVSRPAQAPTRAVLLSAPSSLAVGRTVNAEGMGGMPLTSEAFPAALPSAPLSDIDPVSAALDHVTQMQRSPLPQPYQSVQPTPMQPSSPMPTPAPQRRFSPQPVAPQPVAPQPPTPAPSALKSEGNLEGEWGRLQRIFKSHEVKKSTGATSQPTAPSQAVQRTEMEGTAVPPTPASSPSNQPDSVQRAIHAAESTAESAASPTPAKQAPLESVWPVQQAAPERISDQPLVMRQPDAPIATEPAQPQEQIETIRSKLGGVSSSRQTDSSIELHLPRRPRPAVVQAKPQAEDPNKAFWNRLRKVEGKQPENVQRTVETEIGPLPADMWEILGEPPPGEMPPGAAQPPTTSAAPDVQKQSAEPDAFPTPPAAPQTGETAVPSFLAQASAVDAPTTHPASDAIQRAIAAAEAPTDSTELVGPAAPRPIQRQDTSDTPSSFIAPASVGPAPATTTAPVSQPHSDPPAAPAAPVTHSYTPAEQAVQRAGERLAESAIPSAPDSADWTDTTPPAPDETRRTAPIAQTAVDMTAPIEQAAQIQRAIAAAEAPRADAPIAKSAPPPKTEEVAQSLPKLTLPAMMPEPKSPVSPGVESETLQRSPAAAPVVFNPPAHKTVDLNAKTGPLPVLPGMGETAVSTPVADSEQLTVNSEQAAEAASAAPDAIQRAIAAAEAAPIQETQTAVSTPTATPATPKALQRAIAAAEAVSLQETPTAVPVPTFAPTPTSTAPDAVQRAIAAAETAPTQETQTAVSIPTTTPAAPDAVQRAITAAETVALQETPTAVPVPTFAPTPTSAAPDAVQRAIAAAETAPTQETQTAVSIPTTTPAAPDAIHRAIAAAETTPVQETQTAVSTPPVTSTAPDTVQRAIAAAEAASGQAAMGNSEQLTVNREPLTVNRKQLTEAASAAPEDIQRAIAAAETAAIPETAAPPAKSTAVSAPSYAPTPTSALQRAIAAAETAPAAAHAVSHSQLQTAVASPPALFQELQANEWHVKQETAVSQPAVAPAVAPTHSPTLMRALAAAEKSTAAPVQNRYQWPDIKPTSISTSRPAPAPTSAPSAAENIQRAEITAPDSTSQHLEAEPAAQTEQPPVNIDQLANEVYSQLKKRLAVEWERGRGKR
ncbi:MAG: hypothetical protein R6X34_10010 [Chloroflexota bacterium]